MNRGVCAVQRELPQKVYVRSVSLVTLAPPEKPTPRSPVLLSTCLTILKTHHQDLFCLPR